MAITVCKTAQRARFESRDGSWYGAIRTANRKVWFGSGAPGVIRFEWPLERLRFEAMSSLVWFEERLEKSDSKAVTKASAVRF